MNVEDNYRVIFDAGIRSSHREGDKYVFVKFNHISNS